MDLVTEAEVTASWPAFASLSADERASLISDASQAIEDYCGRTFDSGTVTELYSGDNQPNLWLRRRPVLGVTSITINGATYTNSDNQDWQLKSGQGLVVRGAGLCDPRFSPWFPRGTNNIEVVYDYGYSEVPGPVKRACKLIIRTMSESSKRAGIYTSERIGDYQYTRDLTQGVSFSGDVLRWLAPYTSGAIF